MGGAASDGSGVGGSGQFGEVEVRVRGLQSEAGARLNGRAGVVLSWDGGSQRWQVRLHDGLMKRVRTENLELLRNPSPVTAAPAPGRSVASRAGECVVCLEERTASFAAVPCGHQSVCAECAKKLGSGSACPMCRARVERFVQIFVSESREDELERVRISEERASRAEQALDVALARAQAAEFAHAEAMAGAQHARDAVAEINARVGLDNLALREQLGDTRLADEVLHIVGQCDLSTMSLGSLRTELERRLEGTQGSLESQKARIDEMVYVLCAQRRQLEQNASAARRTIFVDDASDPASTTLKRPREDASASSSDAWERCQRAWQEQSRLVVDVDDE